MTKLIIKNDTTPSTPESGKTALYIDSTTKKLVSKNDAGVETLYDEAGVASSTNALNSATTTVNVSSATAPTVGQTLTATSDSAATWQDAAAGINLPVSSTDNAIVRFDGTSGDAIQDYTSSPPTITDTGIISAPDASWSQSERFGASTSVTGAQASTFGYNSAGANRGTGIGCVAEALGDQSTAIGYNAECTALAAVGVAIGGTSTASAQFATAIGYATTADGDYSLALGAQCDNGGFNNSICMGRQSTALRANSFTLGSVNGYVNYVTIGSGEEQHTGTIKDLLITTSNQITRTDQASADISILGGAGTGTGLGGSVILKAYEVGTTGAVTQTTTSSLLEVNAEQEVILNAEDNATADANLWNNSLSFYLDETAGLPVVKTKNSIATIETFEITGTKDVTFTSSALGTIPLTAKGVASQTANLFSVQDSASKEYLQIMADGSARLDGGTNYISTSSLTSGGDTLALALDSTGKNGLATNGSGNNLAIFNNDLRMLYFTTSGITLDYPVSASNGTVSAPTYRFGGMADGGLWRDSANDSLNMAINGVNKMEWDDNYVSTPVPFAAGSYATGSLPAAASFEGHIVYDSTTQTMKWSNGTAWATI